MLQYLGEIAANLFSIGTTVGLEWNEHERSNYLHREAIAQALRIHEVETNATKEYSRVEVKQSNEQHAREILQSKIMHEEDIDMEKCMAIRENLRDEWEQIVDKAETVLIVNTLMLSASFLFLIEGSLPESVNLTEPVLPVAYSCAIASAMSLLFLSVRLAMTLRFKVGRMIVREMRKEITNSMLLDANWRQSEDYKKCNRPKRTVSACDHPMVKWRVQPLTVQMAATKKEAIAKGSARRSTDLPAFMRQNRDGEDLQWLKEGAGFSITENVRRTLGCPHRALTCRRRWQRAPAKDTLAPMPLQTPNMPESSGATSSLDFTPGAQHPARVSNDASLGDLEGQRDSGSGLIRGFASQGSLQSVQASENTMSQDSDHDRRPVGQEPLLQEPDQEPSDTKENDNVAGNSPSNVLLGDPDNMFHEVEMVYKTQLKARQERDRQLQDRLDRLQKLHAVPYDASAQSCFVMGTLSMLVSACLLVRGRFIVKPVPLPENMSAFPRRVLAAWAFIIPACITVMALIYMEYTHRMERRHEMQERRKSLGEAHRKTEKWEKEDFTPYKITGTVMALLTFSTLILVVTSAATFEEYTAPLGTQAVSHSIPILQTSELILKDSLSWPSFWSPSGAAWLPEGLLLLGGGTKLVAVQENTQGQLDLASISDVGMLVSDVCRCTINASQSAKVWLAGDSSDFVLVGIPVTSVTDGGDVTKGQMQRLDAGHLWSSAAAAAGHVIGCMNELGDTGFWLAANEASWPVVLGVSPEGQDQALVEIRRWLPQRLMSDPTIGHALAYPSSKLVEKEADAMVPQSIVVEAIEVVDGALLFLLSGDSSFAEQPQQLLVAVDGAGLVLKKWRLEALQGRRWVTMAADNRGERVFLVSEGPFPLVKVSTFPS